MHLTVKLPSMSVYSHNIIFYMYILALMWFSWTWNIYCKTIELFIFYSSCHVVVVVVVFFFNLCDKFIVYRRLHNLYFETKPMNIWFNGMSVATYFVYMCQTDLFQLLLCWIHSWHQIEQPTTYIWFEMLPNKWWEKFEMSASQPT